VSIEGSIIPTLEMHYNIKATSSKRLVESVVILSIIIALFERLKIIITDKGGKSFVQPCCCYRRTKL